MNAIRLNIALSKSEYLALEAAGDAECRRPRDTARWILRQELVRRGLLDVPRECDSVQEVARADVE